MWCTGGTSPLTFPLTPCHLPLTSQPFPPELAACHALLTRQQIEEALEKWGEFQGIPLPLMLTPSATYLAYGKGGKRINLTYQPTYFDSLITKQEQEVAQLEAQLHQAKLDLAALHEVRFSFFH